MRNQVEEALNRLNRVQDEELDCAALANLVGYRLQQRGLQVVVIEGVAEGLPVHYRLLVNEQAVDPYEYYYDEPVENFQEVEIWAGEGSRYPVYGPESCQGIYMAGVWERYLSEVAG